jgi:hypothetical protein
MPRSVRLAVYGYNYQKTPVFFRNDPKNPEEGVRAIVPLEFAWNSDNMIYYFTLAAPDGVCSPIVDWVLETYDYVKPTIINQDTGGKMEVKLARRRRGFNRWSVAC